MPLPHFFQLQPGEQLYHYTSSQGALAIIQSQALWLSDYRKMNDPREFLYSKQQYLAAVQDRSIEVDDTVRDLARTALLWQQHEYLMLIGCLTRQIDAPHQWTKYADSGRGCVIGIDAEFLVHDAGVAVRTVSYDPNYLCSFVRAGLLMLQTEVRRDPPDYPELIRLAQFYAADSFAFKEASFSQEQEVRISRLIRRNGAAAFGCLDVGGTGRNNAPLPAYPVATRSTVSGECLYIALPLASRDAQGIRSIGFGPACSQKDRQVIEAAATRVIPNIEVWNSHSNLSPGT